MVRPVSVNIVEIAKKAQVSTASVSRVLNNQSGVSEALRLKIRKILEEEGNYSSHVASRGVKLAVVIEMEDAVISGYTSTILTGIADYSLRKGIDISTVFVSSKQKKDFNLLEVVRERGCDGVLLFFADTVSVTELQKLVEAKIAVLMLSSQCECEKAGFIDVDPVSGANLALKHLWDLGHRRIAFLSGLSEGIFDNTKRAEAFLEFLKGKKVAGHEKLLIQHQPTVHAQEAGYLQANQALDLEGVTAILANNDEMAYGAALSCYERNLVVPEDISIVGFDDYPGSSFAVPPLTSVRQHLQQMGSEATRFIDEYVCGMIDVLPRKVLRPELVVRQSTAPVCK